MTMKKIPTRQCVGCREMKGKNSLIRIIKTDDGTVSIDSTGRKNGRGAYICPTEDCLKSAMKNKGLERSLKIQISDNIFEELKKEMENFEER